MYISQDYIKNLSVVDNLMFTYRTHTFLIFILFFNFFEQFVRLRIHVTITLYHIRVMSLFLPDFYTSLEHCGSVQTHEAILEFKESILTE